MARAVQTATGMVMSQSPATEILGRVAYVDPSKQWGYLHGPAGERIYFHASGVRGGIGELELGSEVCFRVADGGDQLCAAQIARCPGRDR